MTVSVLACNYDRDAGPLGSIRVGKTQLDSSTTNICGSYTLRFNVETASEASPISVIYGGQHIGSPYDAIPTLWSTYSFKGDTDIYSYCKEISVDRDGKSKTRYYVTCKFEPAEPGEVPDSVVDSSGNPINSVANPSARFPKIWFDREAYSQIVIKDKDGKALVNPVNTLYDDVVEHDRTRMVAVVEWNVDEASTFIQACRDFDWSTNNATWSFLGLTNLQARTVLVRDISCGQLKTEGVYKYYPCRCRLAFAETGGTWDEPIPQMGRHAFTKSSSSDYDMEPNTVDTRKRTEMPDLLPLNDDGTRRNDSEPVIVKYWKVRREKDFNTLPFMALLS